MIGGGRGAFIGGVHRIAAQMDGQAELVAGAFSADPAKSTASGADLFLDPSRVYGSYTEMARAEAARPPADRLDFVVIVTPNHHHFAPAGLFLDAGFHVVCDKPVTFNLEQALALRDIVRRSGKIFALTHNYTGNAMVKQARAFVREGRLGAIRKIVVEYPQGWLSTRLEETGQKQAGWRTDPARSGAAGCLGDIGTHAENLARYVTGLRIDEICAELTTFVDGRQLDDDANLLLRFEGGAKGVLHSSQISVGEENALSLRVYGELAGLEWRQEQPNELVLKLPDQPAQIWRRGNGYVGPAAAAVSRVPAGHPEGYLEAFGNIYREFFRAVRADLADMAPPEDLDFPTIDDGVEGMAFIETAVASARSGAVWTKLPSF
jgi:predicted dehydrogenase